ncbi:MAG: NAD(P)/FAD-dependent oxidoreductase [Verrucomicrobia bacterium]|nr:NAD(P)/FAD-dependent oxidoreductase [Verrucomicrobiota bacterium]
MQYDAVIIGGGPAGSTAATYLAQAGKRVLVVEKEHFPRFHIGESLLPYNMPIFKEMGVMPALEAADFIPKYGGRFSLAKGDMENAITFGEGSFTEEPLAMHVERSVFDKILLDHARECGAEVREGWTVKDFSISENDGVAVTITGQHEETIQAAFLIDASGLANFTGNRQQLRQFHPQLQKIAIYGHFTGITLTGDSCIKTETHIACFEDSWFWIIPFTSNKVSIGLVLDRSAVKSTSLTPEQIFQNAVDSSESIKHMMEHSARIGPLRVTNDYSYSNDELVAPRLIRIGDAAGFLDPVFSSGVYLACVTAREASQAITNALDSNQALSSSMKAYEKRTRRNLKRYREVIELFYDRSFIEILLQPEPVLRWPCALNAFLSGRLELPWSLRWRLKTFIWFARIHSRFPLVKKLNFG